MKKVIFDPRFTDTADTLTEQPKCLSVRETEILQLAAEGYSNKQVAHKLYISEDTIDTHNRSIVAKLEAANMKQAVAVGIRKAIIQ